MATEGRSTVCVHHDEKRAAHACLFACTFLADRGGRVQVATSRRDQKVSMHPLPHRPLVPWPPPSPPFDSSMLLFSRTIHAGRRHFSRECAQHHRKTRATAGVISTSHHPLIDSNIIIQLVGGAHCSVSCKDLYCETQRGGSN